MAVDPQAFWNLTVNMFKRNNPVEHWATSVMYWSQELVTFNSKMKLLRYKFTLAQEQLKRMETQIQEDSVVNAKGVKINRQY